MCSRTSQVRDRILRALEMTDCGAVTQAELGRIGALWINEAGISELQDGDFEGLGGLQKLDLGGNDLVSLPSGVFDGLWSLQLLWLPNNRLRALPEGVFDDLGALLKLDLEANRLAWLPDGVFDGLSRLQWLDLEDNRLEELPDGVFDETSNLGYLTLAHNELIALPDGVFGELSHVDKLLFDHNSLIALPDGVFEGLSNLIWLDARSNPTDPFVVGVGLRLMDQAVAVVVPAGAPFDVAATLTVQGTQRYTVEATVEAGRTTSEPVPIVDSGSFSVSIESAEFRNFVYAHGIQLRTGLAE